jgi:hypothetical protein
MHNMSSSLNKKAMLKPYSDTFPKAKDPINMRAITINAKNRIVVDFEKENRLSKTISLYNKGLTQSEIAQFESTRK